MLLILALIYLGYPAKLLFVYLKAIIYFQNLQEFLHGRLERFKQPVAYYPLPSDLVRGAIKISRKVLADGVRTADIARPGDKVSSCTEMGDAVVAAL